ncbi:MAG: DUF1285 domain-containing protein [Porticoccaceae bacterium]|nr:DUF1285 domain-containing protein [Porticoccaceae bacterium]
MPAKIKAPEALFRDITELAAGESLPPVERWNPPLSGDIDIRIDREGHWHHEGDLIEREALVKLFSRILKREGDEHFLVTPVEKWRIAVDVAPFFVTGLEVLEREGHQALVFTTATGDQVVAGPDHPLSVSDSDTGEPQPLLVIRGGMAGLLSRPVFYQLADLVQPGPDDQQQAQGVYSLGQFFPLG